MPAGTAASSQASSAPILRVKSLLPLHDCRFVHIACGAIAEETDDDGKCQADFRRGDGDYEHGEDCAGDLFWIEVGGERNEVQTYSVQHELDGKQDQHRITAGQDAIDTKGEDNGAKHEVIFEWHHVLLALLLPSEDDGPNKGYQQQSGGDHEGCAEVREQLFGDEFDRDIRRRIVNIAGPFRAYGNADQYCHQAAAHEKRER